MEYVIFPMKPIRITQRANGSRSHTNLQAWDIANSEDSLWYAPCTVKVLAINPRPNNYNTVLFGTCDNSGIDNRKRINCCGSIG